MKTKLEQFIIRNRKRNSHLYIDGLTKGIDYIVCPVSKERLSMIKSSYITKILGMTVDEYDQLYPGIRGISQARRTNIKNGLTKIDSNTGLTKYELGQIKARSVLKQVDNTGKTGYKRKGEKARATHMKNVDEFGKNGYSQLATKAIIKGNTTKAKKGLILEPSLRTEFYRYKAVVTYLTEQHRRSLTKGYKTGLAGEIDAYHIDHIYSIMNGYKNKISPLVIGNIKNLRMIPWEENLSKHASSDIDKNTLFQLTNYTQEQSNTEYNLVIGFINDDMHQDNPVSGAKIVDLLYETTLLKK